MEAEGDVDGADVGDGLQVWDAGTLQVGGGGGFAHVYPADGLVSIDEVHGHGLLGGDGAEPGGRGAAQRGAADVVEVGDEQHGQAVHWLWGGRSGGERGLRQQKLRESERESERSPTIFGFAGAVVWLQQVTFHTAAGVRALTVGARLAASPVQVALIKIYRRITILFFYGSCFFFIGRISNRLLAEPNSQTTHSPLHVLPSAVTS